MNVSKGAIKFFAGLYDPFFNILQFIDRIKNLIDWQFLEDHVIIG